MNRKALINATVIGLVLQLAMVLSGHWVEYVKLNLFAGLGTFISLVAGVLYARAAAGGWGPSLLGGAVAGGVCAFLGIAVSAALGDVEPMILALGTFGSTVAGAIGGAIGKLIAKGAPSTA